MNTTPAAPGRPPADSARCGSQSCFAVWSLTGMADRIGRLSDVIVRLRGPDYPVVTGLVARVGSRSLFVPVEQVTSLDGAELRLTSARLDLRQFERRDGEVLLRADVLGHRLIDVENARLTRAADLELAPALGEWVVTGVDTPRRPRRLLGALRAGPACRRPARR